MKKQNLYKISSYMNKIFYNSITQKYIQLVKAQESFSSKNLNIIILIDVILKGKEITVHIGTLEEKFART